MGRSWVWIAARGCRCGGHGGLQDANSALARLRRGRASEGEELRDRLRRWEALWAMSEEPELVVGGSGSERLDVQWARQRGQLQVKW